MFFVLFIVLTFQSSTAMYHNRPISFYDAVKRGNEAIVEQELAKNPLLANCIFRNGSRPLHEAAAHGHVAIVKKLIEVGANCNQVANEFTPLQWALLHHKNVEEEQVFDIAKLLLENGASLIPEQFGRGNPLQVAVTRDYERVTQLLLDNNFSPNVCDERGFMPLHIAVLRGNKRMVCMLITAKADVNSETTRNASALSLARKKRLYDIVDVLIKAGAPIEPDRKDRLTELHAAVMHKDLAMVQRLVENKADINAKTTQGAFALKIAVTKGCTDIVEYLLEKNANVDLKDELGMTPLLLLMVLSKDFDEDPDYEFPSQKREIFELLIWHKANISACSPQSYCTPLLLAAKHDPWMTKRLIEQNASVEDCDKQGNNALHKAVFGNSPSTVRLLLNAKVDPYAKNKNRQSAYFLAKSVVKAKSCTRVFKKFFEENA